MKHRLATWNLDRAKFPGLISHKLEEIAADIFVFTESSHSLALPAGYEAVHALEYERYRGFPWVSILSKWPILKQLPTFDPYRTLSCLVEMPFGEIIVYGTIIPYHMAGVSGARYPHSGKRVWQLHMEEIVCQSEDWQLIRQSYPGTPMVVAGDFNQTRDGEAFGYGTSAGRRLLSQELSRNNLQCLTELDFGKAGHLTADPKTGKIRRNIDHICMSTDLYSSCSYTIAAWDHFAESRQRMSDHNGVYIDFSVQE